MSYLLTRIALYGDVLPLKFKLDYKKFEKGLKLFDDKWVQYNPRKNIPREGLSITSLDGGFSGIPDLDSLKEYNEQHNIYIDEYGICYIFGASSNNGSNPSDGAIFLDVNSIKIKFSLFIYRDINTFLDRWILLHKNTLI